MSFLSSFRKFEALLVVLLLLGAAWLRFGDLVNVPGGFHGDEAVSGIEAKRILKEGSIGPYSPLALGQPSGPLYLTALSIRVFGETIWAVRAVSALLGTLSVALLYFLLRRSHGREVALVAALFLATLDWHIHFSRIGFPVIAWPLCALAATFAALEAVKREQARWWALTGLITGIGIYSYNAHVLVIAALGVWTLFYLARKRDVALKVRAGWLLGFAVVLALVALPMVRYALDPANDYFSHSRMISLFSAPDSSWPKDAGAFAKIEILAGRVVGFWDNLSLHSNMDWGDSTGVVPVVPLGILVLGALGLVLTPKNKRGALMGISLCCLLFSPLGPVLTVNGLTRRAFALAPFLCFLAALGLVEIWKRACGPLENGRTSKTRRIAATAMAALVCALLAGQNLSDYFGHFAPAPQRAWTFVEDFTDACAFIKALPPTSRVLFYSDRWSGNYEPRQFLAPDANIEDRSSEFGTFSRREPRAGRAGFRADGHLQGPVGRSASAVSGVARPVRPAERGKRATGFCGAVAQFTEGFASRK